MINDYAEVTATMKPKITKLDHALESKDWLSAQALIVILRSDFMMLEEFVDGKLKVKE